MKAIIKLTKRNILLFFKDKGTFFTSLMAPLVLLLLFIAFLGSVYREIIEGAIPEGIEVAEGIMDGFVGGWLFSSLIAVSCITVAFCANMIMVQDKVNSSIHDLLIAPVKKSTLAISYYIATTLVTLIICLIALFVGFIYLGVVGWYLSVGDVFLCILDVVLLVMFGTALSSIVNYFLKTQGQIAAVGTIVSATYGFICGAYMPISQLSKGIQNVISFLPGTYGTGITRNHMIGGVLRELKSTGIPDEVIKQLRDMVDCNLYFFDEQVSTTTMIGIVVGAVVILVGVYILLNVLLGNKKKEKKIVKK